jgi:hypothetical protein
MSEQLQEGQRHLLLLFILLYAYNSGRDTTPIIQYVPPYKTPTLELERQAYLFSPVHPPPFAFGLFVRALDRS